MGPTLATPGNGKAGSVEADERLAIATTVAPITSIVANIAATGPTSPASWRRGPTPTPSSPSPAWPSCCRAFGVVYLTGLVLEEGSPRYLTGYGEDQR